MSTIGLLPERCRSCVQWELPADAVDAASALGQSEFEKEVWLSGVMLTWGSAGQVVTVDDQPVGFALYAPPTAVPGAVALPTAPVSPDAVLLTTARIAPGYTGQGLARYLMNGVVADLTRRGVRAIELFGRTEVPAPESLPSPSPAPTGRSDRDPGLPDELDAELERRVEADLLDPGVPRCLLPAAFAQAVGFTEVAHHPRYPRLRYELRSGSGWKADVEAALEKLFTVITVPSTQREPELVGSR